MENDSKKIKVLNLRLTEEERRKIEVLAKNRGCTLSDAARDILRQGIDRTKTQELSQ